MSDSAYFQGKTEAEIEEIFDDILEIRRDVSEIKNMLNGLVNWKYRITGIAVGVSVVCSFIIKLWPLK